MYYQSHPSRQTAVILFNHNWRDKEVHTFPKSIGLKVNIIAQLEFELTHFEVTI